ncbi:MAG: hypothetical protein KIT02_16615 [Devosia sp.]|uniref:hypothetical protein n=1 Tax=Devosia sp. TaxID=1871048 RepID=UPI0024CB7F02|nr:hypothetical protein [Devosia sp.]UYN99504.1 MAG: hypothetical protein KIT02_16615 [Devosia sp.]
MYARLSLLALALALPVSAPALAKEKFKPAPTDEIACEGAFAIDSSEQRLIEIYGADNVWTGTVPGPEGIEMLATRVFDGDPDKQIEFVWWDEDKREGPSYIELNPSMTGPGGVRVGQSMDEVEAINGEPFTLSGFGWDYGGSTSPQSGALSDFPGDCILSLRFSPQDYPADVDTDSVMGDREVSSDNPILDAMDVRVDIVSIGYPHPDFR